MHDPTDPAEPTPALTPEAERAAADIAAVLLAAWQDGANAYNHARRSKLIKASLTASNLAILLQLAAEHLGLDVIDPTDVQRAVRPSTLTLP